MPLIVFTASSILSVTSVSTCSGAAPGSRVVTTMVGMSMLGSWSIPSRPNEKAPTTASETISTDANTGRRTQISASHCMTNLLCGGDFRAVGQSRDVGDRDQLTVPDAGGDLHEIPDRLSGRHHAFLDVIACAHEDARAASSILQGRLRDQD